jgi:hypothetical protein
MRTARKVLIPLFATALILAGALILSWADGDVELSGITVEDAHPNGCVDCHAVAGDNDYRLNEGLKGVDGHPDVTRIVRNVPGDCGMCHKANVPAGALSEVVHIAHYANPDENHFVGSYAGECLACHALNTSTGAMSNKSGPKNW